MNYFAIERGETYLEHVVIRDYDGSVVFSNYLDMTYDELKSQDDLSEFVMAVMEATDSATDSDSDQTIITLIGEDDIFIWSIIMGTVDDEVRYNLVDWKKDGNNYRYES